MALIARSQNCCGVRELYSLGGQSIDIIHQVAHAIQNQNLNAAYYWFADREGTPNGKRLARYIVNHSLGKLTEMPPVPNPQSKCNLIFWLWQIDQKAIIKLSQEKQ